jgi:uncharacterized protein (TIGR00297 family)
MDEEMTEEAPAWRKAIPEGRDRWQSRWLVGLVGAGLVLATFQTFVLALPKASQFPAFVLDAFGVSLVFAVVVLALKAATPSGALCGGMICLVLTFWTDSFTPSVARTALTPLAILFVLTFLATRGGKRRKAKAGLAEGRRGRSASQIIANLSAAALCVTPWMEDIISRTMRSCCVSGIFDVGIWQIVRVMCLAALVEATADTVSSEIGQAFGGRPVMLLSWKRVEVGTDGAVTLPGSGAGILAGALVAAVGMWALRLTPGQAVVVLVAGICGLFFDSLLGATLERRGWLGNDLVNFSSTVFAAGLGALIFRVVALGR